MRGGGSSIVAGRCEGAGGGGSGRREDYLDKIMVLGMVGEESGGDKDGTAVEQAVGVGVAVPGEGGGFGTSRVRLVSSW